MSRHARPRRPHRAPGPPTRKAPLLLTAAVAGALFAALPFGLGSADGTTPSSVASVVLPARGGGIGGDASLPPSDSGLGGAPVAGQGPTAAAAQTRSEFMAAGRASRAARRAEPRFALPVAGRLTSCFCLRWGTMHWGIDIAAPMFTPIKAVADGVVTEAGPASGFGNVVYVQHENGDVTVYGHMEVVEVHAGETVTAGQEIAEVGSRGYSTGPHLHFEVFAGGLDGQRIDPVRWLAARGVPCCGW